jgi:hypothetical protein
MAKISGKGGKVMYGSVTLANITEWSMSGVSMATIKKDPAFGDSVVEKEPDGVSEPGQISFKGSYDPADRANGQGAIAAQLKLGTKLTNLYLYANTNTFWRVGTGGSIIITKADAITLPRSGMGSIDFAGEVESACMEQFGTGT